MGGLVCELPTGPATTAAAAVEDTANDELLTKVHLLFHAAFRSEMDGIVHDARMLERMYEAEGAAAEPRAASTAADASSPLVNPINPGTDREGQEDAHSPTAALHNLRNRYDFLYKCYKFHSRAEDQVRAHTTDSHVGAWVYRPLCCFTTACPRAPRLARVPYDTLFDLRSL